MNKMIYFGNHLIYRHITDAYIHCTDTDVVMHETVRNCLHIISENIDYFETNFD